MLPSRQTHSITIFGVPECCLAVKRKFAENIRRGDLDPVKVTNNNVFLSEKLGVNFYRAKMVKRADFNHDKTCHFNKEDQDFIHLATMILCVIKEFLASR